MLPNHRHFLEPVLRRIYETIRRFKLHVYMPKLTFSASQISISRLRIWESVSLAYRKTAHRDWIGSIILLDWLHASANLVVFEYISIVRRKAC